jgi:hypothetical protein
LFVSDPSDAGEQAATPASLASPATAPITLRAYARHRQVNPSQVSRAVRSGRLSASVSWSAGRPWIADVDLADREWAAATDFTTAPASVLDDHASAANDGAPGSVAQSVAIEKHWRAKNAELEYKKKIGELVEAQSIETAMKDDYARVRNKLLSLPRKLKALLPHLTLADVNKIDAEIREALEALADGDFSHE